MESYKECRHFNDYMKLNQNYKVVIKRVIQILNSKN